MTFLKTCKLLSGRSTRLIMAVQDYDILIEHCTIKNNLVADTLSRLPEKENGQKILYALVKRPSSILRNRLQNFSRAEIRPYSATRYK